MKKSKIALPSYITEAHKYYETQVDFLTHIECDNLENAKRKYDGLHREMEGLKNKLQEICEITGTNHIGNAFQRLRKTFKSNQDTSLIEKYGLDISFLDRPSPAWICSITIDDDNWEQKRDEWQKKKKRWRESCERMFLFYLKEVYDTCQEEEGLEEEDFGAFMVQARDAVELDYLSLTYRDFWRKYDEDVDVTLQIVEQSSVVPLQDCLLFVKNTTPHRLYRDLVDYGDMLGEISRIQYDRWETFYTNANQKSIDEGYPELRRLTFTIVGAMLYRCLGKAGWPTPQEENAFYTLLSTVDENEAGGDWPVENDTSLPEVCSMFAQLAGGEI
jgi:hypothetical protein